MRVKQILINATLIVALITASSCDNDEGNTGPAIGANKAKASLKGDVDLEINSVKAPNVVKARPLQKSELWGNLIVSWYSDSVTVLVNFPDKDAGTYEADSLNVSVSWPGSTWLGKSGSIEITANDSNNVVGLLNDIKVAENKSDRTAILNGKFNASK